MGNAIADLLSELHCPYCGAGFDVDVRDRDADGAPRYGILRCACYRYPLVDGIPILRQTSSAANTRDEVTELVGQGDFAGALDSVLTRRALPRRSSSSLLGRVLRKPSRSAPDERPAFLRALAEYRTPLYADYLYYRYANNSFLGSIPLILFLREALEEIGAAGGDGARPRIVDIGCGVGHATHMLEIALPGAEVIATDHDFVNLHQARAYVAREALYVCCDAEAPLPFADDTFDAVMCTDAFHYIRSKAALVAEMDRIGRSDGIWVLPHLHNAASDRNPTPGIPLTQADYRRVLGRRPLLVLRESDIIDEYVAEGALDLRYREDCPEGDVFSVVATRSERCWRRYEHLDDALLRDAARLAVNPIYRIERGEGLRLTLDWPNSSLASECADSLRYLRREVTLPAARADALADAEALREQIRRFTLLPLPPGYEQRA